MRSFMAILPCYSESLTPPDVETGVADGAQKDGHAGQGQGHVSDINWPVRAVTRTPLRAGVHYTYLLLLAGSMLRYYPFSTSDSTLSPRTYKSSLLNQSSHAHMDGPCMHWGMFIPTASRRKFLRASDEDKNCLCLSTEQLPALSTVYIDQLH